MPDTPLDLEPALRQHIATLNARQFTEFLAGIWHKHGGNGPSADANLWLWEAGAARLKEAPCPPHRDGPEDLLGTIYVLNSGELVWASYQGTAFTPHPLHH